MKLKYAKRKLFGEWVCPDCEKVLCIDYPADELESPLGYCSKCEKEFICAIDLEKEEADER